jgi:hypothetical protein
MQQALGGGEMTWGQQEDAETDPIDDMDFDWREHKCAFKPTHPCRCFFCACNLPLHRSIVSSSRATSD